MDKQTKSIYSADLLQGAAEASQLSWKAELAAQAAAAHADTKEDVAKAASEISLKRLGKINLAKKGLAEAFLEYEILTLVAAGIEDNATMKWWLCERVKHSPSRELRDSFRAFLKAKDDEGHWLFNGLCQKVRTFQRMVAKGEVILAGWATIKGENLAAKQDKHARLKAAGKLVNQWLGEGGVIYTT